MFVDASRLVLRRHPFGHPLATLLFVSNAPNATIDAPIAYCLPPDSSRYNPPPARFQCNRCNRRPRCNRCNRCNRRSRYDPPPTGFQWLEGLTGHAARFADDATAPGHSSIGRCYLAPDGRPQVLVLRPLATRETPIASAAVAVVLSAAAAVGVASLCWRFRGRLGGDAVQPRGSVIAMARLRVWGGGEPSSMAPVLSASSPQSDDCAPSARL